MDLKSHVPLATALLATPAIEQSDGSTIEGQFFRASAKNVARSAKTGRVIVTVLFRGVIGKLQIHFEGESAFE